MGNSAVSKSRRHLGELSGTSFGQRRYQSALRDRGDADESGISTSPSCNHSSSYSPTRDLLTAEPAVCIILRNVRYAACRMFICLILCMNKVSTGSLSLLYHKYILL